MPRTFWRGLDEDADTRFLASLGMRRKGRDKQSGSKMDEIAPVHSITRSARNWIDAGIVPPSAVVAMVRKCLRRNWLTAPSRTSLQESLRSNDCFGSIVAILRTPRAKVHLQLLAEVGLQLREVLGLDKARRLVLTASRNIL